MSLKKILLLAFILGITCAQKAVAQQIPVNLNALSPQQFSEWISKMGWEDLPEAELINKAKQMGISPLQIEELKQRISSQANSSKKNTKEDSNKRIPLKNKNYFFNPDSTPAFPIFGADIFQNQFLSFEPDLSISTPEQYIIGANDQLIIDVFGVSDVQEKLLVSPEGFIRFPNYGPIKVAGLSIENARLKIKQSLTKIYPGLSNGTVGIQLSLGQIRSIRVTLIGEVVRPGNYTISSLSTIMNALYASGGPSSLGSFRAIDLVRNGNKISNFDLYDFLIHGDLSKNLLLQNGDVIKINPVQNRVALKGAVKRQGLYDVKSSESANDILNYAGGFADMAIKNSISIARNGSTRKEVLTVDLESLKNTKLVSGDTLYVDSIRFTFKNKVVVSGAVEHPGIFGADQVKDLTSLLKLAVPSNTAYRKRAILKRYTDQKPSLIGFDIDELENNKFNIQLQGEDSIQVFSKSDLQEQFTVQINGEVNLPGDFMYYSGMKIMDLILMANGLKESAAAYQMEVSRRMRFNNDSKQAADYVIIKQVSLDTNSLNTQSNLALEPYDRVSIRQSASYRKQAIVTLEGEVLYPGEYSFSQGTEKLSDIVKRAGGLKPSAFSDGANLLRKMQLDPAQSDSAWFRRQLTEMGKLKINENISSAFDYKESDLIDTSLLDIKKWLNDSSMRSWSPVRLKPVGIQLNQAIAAPGNSSDILLEDGDVLVIPSIPNTIQVLGAVHYPKPLVYTPSMTVRSAIRHAGGIKSNGSRNKSYVVYANGEVKSAGKFLFLTINPKLKPGAELHIPAKADRKGISTGEAVGIISGLTSLVSLLFIIFR